MKKHYLAFLLFFSFTSISKATTFDEKASIQRSSDKSSDNSGCFDENTRLLNLGIGFGGGNYYKGVKGSAYVHRISPAFSLNYEQAWKPKIGPGFLGVGGYIAYQHTSYRYNYGYNNYYYKGTYYNGSGYYYEHNWNHFMIAGRAAYHWDVLNSEKAEVYAGVLIGVRIQTYSYTTNDTSPYRSNYELNENNIYPTYSLFAGARWYFAPKFALFGEVGYGISYITGGISFKI